MSAPVDHNAPVFPLLPTLTTATADTPRGIRLRGLLGELNEVMTGRLQAKSSPARLADLSRVERDVWDHIAETISEGEARVRP